MVAMHQFLLGEGPLTSSSFSWDDYQKCATESEWFCSGQKLRLSDPSIAGCKGLCAQLLHLITQRVSGMTNALALRQ